MRIALILLAILAGGNAYAQDEIKTDILLLRYPKNEIGLAGETNFSNEKFGGPGMVQYKRWVRENMSYRVNAGVGTYSDFSHDGYFGIIGDTILEKQTREQATMAFAGGGVEMQRHFFKTVYLYAAVDLLAGYGQGKTEDYIVRRVEVDGQDYTESTPTPGKGDISIFHLNIAPFIGAKIVFNRISFGTEMSAINMSYTGVKDNFTGSSGITELNMGFLRQRFFIHYRFN